MNKHDLYEEAFKLWGYDSQFRMMTEEIGEFLQAASKYGRKINGSTKEQIIEEAADAINTIEGFLFMLDIPEIDVKNKQIEKLNKLNKIIKQYKELETQTNL